MTELSQLQQLPPGSLLFLGALLVLLAPAGLRPLLLVLAPIASALHLSLFSVDDSITLLWMGMELMPVRLDKLALLFAYLFHLAALLGVIYALHQRDRLQEVASLAYAASAVGAVCAGDLLTLFIYWELLAVTSVLLIVARRTLRATRAALRYLIIQICSGLLLLAGTLWYGLHQQSWLFNHIGLAAPGGVLIFLAFGIKSAFPLLHNWLTDAYPEATATGTVFLTAFTTKVAIYALARGYAGTEILIYIGALMACFPIFFAVIENDLRRVLAYSLINQLGFMVVGIGIGTELAINGAVAHAFNDVIFKGLLMMSMGAVLTVTGEMRGSELGGLHRKMPLTTTFCIIGAASISAFPLFSGFVSKSMIVSAVLLADYPVVWLALLFASAGVFHHAGIKIPFFAFFYKPSVHVESAHEAPRNMLIAMAVAAALCIGIGCYPQALYQHLPYTLNYSAYDSSHVLAQLQLLAFSALAFTWLKLSGIYPPELKSTNLDAEWLYRYWGAKKLSSIVHWVIARDYQLRHYTCVFIAQLTRLLALHHGSHGVLARTWPTGSMVLWVALLLGLTLTLYYVE